MASYESRVVWALIEIEELMESVIYWLAQRYDSSSGGFFYAPSSEHVNVKIPDIESTAQALNILERYDLLSGMPDDVRQQLIGFFQMKQQDTGYFLDDNPMMAEDDVMVARALSYGLGALKKLGGKPLHRLPNTAGALPSYMKTPEAYGVWLRSVSLSNSWRGCDRLCVSGVYIKQLTEEKRPMYLHEAFSYFASIQDPVTGLWGQGNDYVKISGTFKLFTFYQQFQRQLPNEGAIYQSVMKTLTEKPAKDMCYVRNSVNLLAAMEREIELPDVTIVLEAIGLQLKRLKQKDGGFSREISGSLPAPNVGQVKKEEKYSELPQPVILGAGLMEGDMNATTQAVLIHRLCYQLAKRPFPFAKMAGVPFYSLIKSKEA
ncbi:hypothetical protein P4641_02085 [Halalkalibacterium halodurans]|uniref:hypothetical protein n=1 Tax=Halalkalibacterium halodurans TaxID=86665 RepID=UPI002E1A7F87|nr:hypothetical protein [Halalkalibacterium halodurans]